MDSLVINQCDVHIQNKFVWTVWLLTNEIFISLAESLKCKFLTIPD